MAEYEHPNVASKKGDVLSKIRSSERYCKGLSFAPIPAPPLAGDLRLLLMKVDTSTVPQLIGYHSTRE